MNQQPLPLPSAALRWAVNGMRNALKVTVTSAMVGYGTVTSSQLAFLTLGRLLIPLFGFSSTRIYTQTSALQPSAIAGGSRRS